jgi:hypothetical protein
MKLLSTSIWAFFFLSVFFQQAQAQAPSQTMRGKVYDLHTKDVLSGATVQLKSTEYVTSADEEGAFRFENLPVGRYRVQVTFVGYDTLLIEEVLLQAGKETILDLPMAYSAASLEGFTVTAAPLELSSIAGSVRSISNETTLRFPATFFDAARTVTTFPGVAQVNDQGNLLSVRGNSPNSNQWRLEGVEIVNPNHTSNAGTFSDNPTLTGGGVNMLSTQMLGNSAFYSSAYPAEFGNAIGGIFDMHLRPGNNEKREYTLQTSLIGLDAAAEGYIGKPGGASYLVNGRYSTLGLLGAMGVDLGDEAIGFQDLAYNLLFPIGQRGKLSVFGMHGSSSNVFRGLADSTLWEEDKQRFDIDFKSSTNLSGFTLSLPLGRGIWKTTYAFSRFQATREANSLLSLPNVPARTFYELQDTKNSLHSYWSNSLGARSSLKVGLQAVFETYFQPYVSWDYRSKFWEFSVGFSNQVAINLNDSNNGGGGLDLQIDPRLGVKYKLGPRSSITYSYGAHQMQTSLRDNSLRWFSYSFLSDRFDESSPTPTRADHHNLSFRSDLRKAGVIEVQAYYQNIYNAATYSEYGFSSLNYMEGNPLPLNVIPRNVYISGTGRNYGLELNWQKYWSKGFFFLFNTSFFKSEHFIDDDQLPEAFRDESWRPTRFATGFLGNLTTGKEWTKTRAKGKIKTLGINGRLAFSGNLRDTPIDLDASQKAGTTVYETPRYTNAQGQLAFREDRTFSIQQPTYFRTDLRFYLKWNKTGRSNTLALDIQNATNNQNSAYSYYDAVQKQILRKQQLGIIPILSYRVEF